MKQIKFWYAFVQVHMQKKEKRTMASYITLSIHGRASWRPINWDIVIGWLILHGYTENLQGALYQLFSRVGEHEMIVWNTVTDRIVGADHVKEGGEQW